MPSLALSREATSLQSLAFLRPACWGFFAIRHGAPQSINHRIQPRNYLVMDGTPLSYSALLGPPTRLPRVHEDGRDRPCFLAGGNRRGSV